MSSNPKRIRAVEPIGAHRLRLTLSDGAIVERDFSRLLEGPVFGPLRDDARLFARARVCGGALVWPNGADICGDVVIWGGVPPRGPRLCAPRELVLERGHFRLKLNPNLPPKARREAAEHYFGKRRTKPAKRTRKSA